MKVIFDKHIGIFENAMTNQWCDKIIDLYDQNHDQTKNRFQDEDGMPSLLKNDHTLPVDLVDEKFIIEFKSFF